MNIAALKPQTAEAIPAGMTAARKCGTAGARLKSSAGFRVAPPWSRVAPSFRGDAVVGVGQWRLRKH